MLGFVVICQFGGFGLLFREVLLGTGLDGEERSISMIRRFDLLDVILMLSSKRIFAIQPTRSAAAEEKHPGTGQGKLRHVKRGVFAGPVGTTPHFIKNSTHGEACERLRQLDGTRFRPAAWENQGKCGTGELIRQKAGDRWIPSAGIVDEPAALAGHLG